MAGVLFLLLLAQTPDYEATIAALEATHQKAPLPEIMLSIAAAYEQWPNHCKEAIATYQRFFDLYPQSPELPRAIDRFDRVLERCVASADEEAALREQYRIPAVRAAPLPGEATRTEVVDLLRRGRAIDREQANRTLVTLIEAGIDVPLDRLNQMREEAWAILLRADADYEQVLALVTRVKVVDLIEHRELVVMLLEAGAHDQRRLNEIRTRAIAKLRSASKRMPDGTSEACSVNLANEPGYLTIGSTPWGVEVYVNGEKAGTTPLSKHKVMAGCATIRFVSPETGLERTANITVRPNRVTVVKQDLTREPGGSRSLELY